jgi:hypothetical protein
MKMCLPHSLASCLIDGGPSHYSLNIFFHDQVSNGDTCQIRLSQAELRISTVSTRFLISLSFDRAGVVQFAGSEAIVDQSNSVVQARRFQMIPVVLSLAPAQVD